MSQSGRKTADQEKIQRVRREKNRIAQQKHREKRKNDIKKMMSILQKVKLAATKNDMGLVQELVKSPSIVLPTEPSPPSIPCQVTTPVLDVEEIFTSEDDSSSSSQPLTFIEPGTMLESIFDGQDVCSDVGSQSCAKVDELVSLSTQSLFQPTMDPLVWNMANMFAPYQTPYFDSQHFFPMLPPMAMPSPWDSYPTIMAGM